jgi:SCP-2 sterol transfer family
VTQRELDYAARVEVTQAAENNGLASMVSGLILQNLQEHPNKRADFARLHGRVAIVAEDAGVALTLEFTGNMLTVHDGILGVPDVTVRARGDDIVQMSLLELTPRFGLPDPRGTATREIARKSWVGHVRVYGALLHIPLLLRLSRLLSVN